uniref:Coiled-coil domain-containing protein 85C n=1 Tax=Octopus bimaculoides TaxID=37653 RepID=A0A0L8G4E8_OCTBM
MTSNLISKSRIAEGDPRHKSHEEVLHMVQQLQSENKNLMLNHDTMVKDINRRLQVHLMEIRGLKSVNQKLQDDNQELRDLCCFLDDERQSGKKLAKDWQKFGRYTASVMQTEVMNYHEKLRELEMKQEELIKDNLEMQELCLYMGREHLFDNDRDDGDGSSNGTTGGNEKIEEVNQTQTPSGDQSGQNCKFSSMEFYRNI